jgi:hypothetical protein
VKCPDAFPKKEIHAAKRPRIVITIIAKSASTEQTAPDLQPRKPSDLVTVVIFVYGGWYNPSCANRPRTRMNKSIVFGSCGATTLAS